MPDLKELLADYHAARTAAATGLTPAQVKRVNAFEANADEGEPFNVERCLDSVRVEFVWEGFYFARLVRPDGSTRNG